MKCWEKQFVRWRFVFWATVSVQAAPTSHGRDARRYVSPKPFLTGGEISALRVS
jgi:hypothetical protein